VIGHGEKLSRKQDEAIAALLSAPTIKEAAAAVGVDEKTVRRWLGEPDFAAAFRDARRQIVEEAITRAQQSTVEAVATLRRLLTCGHPPTEARAAASLYDRAVRGVELSDLVQAVEELRREVEALKHGHGTSQPPAADSPAAVGDGEAAGGPGHDGADAGG
jgi:hypothetical protein